MNKPTIVVAFGGASPEHEVSVLTAMQAIAALENSSYNTIPLYVSKSGKWLTGKNLLRLENYENLDKLVKKAVPCTIAHNRIGKTVIRELSSPLIGNPREYSVYAVLSAFHGADGENGSFQGVCEMFNLPYTGSGVMGSAIGMDKVTAKALCRSYDIPVVDGINFFESEWIDNAENITSEIESLGYPLVVKPVHLGSSIGVTITSNREELIQAIELAFRYDEQLLVENAISPLTEINCSVLGLPEENKTSVCERPLAKNALLSFRDKYQGDDGVSKGMASADRIIPADISDELTKKIQGIASEVFRAMRASGLARLDFLVNSETDEVYFNEINTIPGSFSFYLWEKSGIGFQSLLLELINIAVKRHQLKNGRIQSYDTNLLNQKAVKGIKGLKGIKTESS